VDQKPRPPVGFLRLLKVALTTVVISYVGMCLLVFTFQRNLLFHPTVRSAAEVDQLAQAAHMERWTNAAGQFIGLRRLAAHQPAAGTVFMMYGNGSTAVGCSYYADAIQSAAPLDFYVLEYPGYEDRPGAPTKESLLNAAQEAFQRLDTNQPIYLVGESLGTGVASYLAGEHPGQVTGIMLLSPYHRLADVAQRHYPMLPVHWLMLDDFWSEHYLKKFHGLVGVMIDGQDSVVPAKFGHQLYDGYTGPKRLWEYPNCNHIQLGESPETFWQAVVNFWQVGQTNVSAATVPQPKI
jgi:pimeloyl-ACP methyl ester carboxylesterase